MKSTCSPIALTIILLANSLPTPICPAAEEPVFSGPQIGEKLVPFKARAAVGEQTGQEFDLVSQGEGRPLVIVFVHELTRPSAALTRIVVDFAKQHREKGMTVGAVFLGDDLTELEATLKRAAHALPSDVPVGVSLDGGEGPGAYGLNRNMSLTVLVAKENRVTANFALVQPSVAADAPEIGHAIVKVLGGEKKPTLEEMGGERAAMMQRRPAAGATDDATFRALLAPVIRKTASPEQVAAAAKKVEVHAAKDEAFKHRVADVAGRIIEAGRLENYGTPAAQEYLKKWAKEFAASEDEGEDEGEKEAEPKDEAPDQEEDEKESGSEGDDSKEE